MPFRVSGNGLSMSAVPMSQCLRCGSWCANLKAEIIEPAATAMIPQVHVASRTAELDFGDVWVIVSGEKTRASTLGMRVSPKVSWRSNCFGSRQLPGIL